METVWTPEKIEELSNWCKKHNEEKKYAKEIAEKIASLDSLNEQVREAYKLNLSYNELEIMWAMQTRMEKSIAMKIKHFFKIVYCGDNALTRSLKGKTYLDHYFKFKDFVGPCYNIKIV